jgi:hypothetical protein
VTKGACGGGGRSGGVAERGNTRMARGARVPMPCLLSNSSGPATTSRVATRPRPVSLSSTSSRSTVYASSRRPAGSRGSTSARSNTTRVPRHPSTRTRWVISRSARRAVRGDSADRAAASSLRDSSVPDTQASMRAASSRGVAVRVEVRAGEPRRGSPVAWSVADGLVEAREGAARVLRVERVEEGDDRARGPSSAAPRGESLSRRPATAGVFDPSTGPCARTTPTSACCSTGSSRVTARCCRSSRCARAPASRGRGVRAGLRRDDAIPLGAMARIA